jgi:hypothetical protein
MKKENILIGICILFILILCILSFILYKKSVTLGVERENLILERDSLIQQNDELLNERERLRIKIDSLHSELDLIKDDLLRISKSCLSEGACKGRFPNISWYCNVVGDEVSDPSHTCFCDSSCKLNVTEI